VVPTAPVPVAVPVAVPSGATQPLQPRAQSDALAPGDSVSGDSDDDEQVLLKLLGRT
jgi:hypothetical protein